MSERIDIDALGAELDAAKPEFHRNVDHENWADAIRKRAVEYADTPKDNWVPYAEPFHDRIVAAAKQVIDDGKVGDIDVLLDALAPSDPRSVAREDFRKAILRAVTELSVAKCLGAQYARQDELMIQDVEAFGEFISVTRQTLDAFIDRINAAEREREVIMRGECRNEPVRPREPLQTDLQDW